MNLLESTNEMMKFRKKMHLLALQIVAVMFMTSKFVEIETVESSSVTICANL